MCVDKSHAGACELQERLIQCLDRLTFIDDDVMELL